MSSNSNENVSDLKTIYVVQHLIEKCLLFYMDRDQCAACLEKNANLKPAITRIVWDELEKANIEFFTAYAARRMEVLHLGGAHMRQDAPSPSTVIICHQDKENQQAANQCN